MPWLGSLWRRWWRNRQFNRSRGAFDSPDRTSPPPAPTPEPEETTEAEAARFLSQATFGPTAAAIQTVVEAGIEAWFLQQLAEPPSLHLEDVLAKFPPHGRFYDEQGNTLQEIVYAASDSFWEKAISADDQLRQRMAYALSQIMVISAQGNLTRVPQTVAAYMDVLTRDAFGNFRDLMEDVTYSPAMAVYLTYLRNEKTYPKSGRVPDENYARELLQLFTVGLFKLQPDGEPVTDKDEKAVELFDNKDVTNLARVFTGLSFAGAAYNTPLERLPFDAFYQPLQMFNAYHSIQEKNFLGTSIPANTGGRESIEQALDTIFQHPNVGPFIARQLIQRFITSNPSRGYISRVADAFNTGMYALPSGSQTGSGKRGDLSATLAAVLFDPRARDDSYAEDPEFGKLREPVIRFTHWARAFEVNSAKAGNERLLRDTSSAESLGQHPYRSPSVFNFYRPGYIAPGTETGAAQAHGAGAADYQCHQHHGLHEYPDSCMRWSAPRKSNPPTAGHLSSRTTRRGAWAGHRTPVALLDHLDLLLTHGTLLQLRPAAGLPPRWM